MTLSLNPRPSSTLDLGPGDNDSSAGKINVTVLAGTQFQHQKKFLSLAKNYIDNSISLFFVRMNELQIQHEVHFHNMCLILVLNSGHAAGLLQNNIGLLAILMLGTSISPLDTTLLP